MFTISPNRSADDPWYVMTWIGEVESEDDDEDGDGIDDDASPDKRSRDGSAASWAKAKVRLGHKNNQHALFVLDFRLEAAYLEHLVCVWLGHRQQLWGMTW